MRRFSTLVTKSSPRPHPWTVASTSNTADDDDSDALSESKVSAFTVTRDESSRPAPSLKVKRVDHYFSRWTKSWKYRNMDAKVTVENIPILQSGNNDPWKDYSFVIVRKMPRHENMEPTFKIVIKSEYILKACKDVIQTWPGISWNSDPLELDPEIFLTFLTEFTEYRDALSNKKPHSSDLDMHLLSSVSLLISTISTDYRSTISKINRLTQHGEMTFDLLYSILVPRTFFVGSCAVTRRPRLFKLVSFTRTTVGGMSVYQLICENVDLMNQLDTFVVGRVHTVILIKYFKGTVRIQSLDVFPLKYHPDEKGLKEMLITRGKKWAALTGIHHKQYNGIAAIKSDDKVVKHNVKGRIMIDAVTFRRLNATHQFPIPAPSKSELAMMEQAHPANGTYDFPVAPLPTMPPPPRVPFGGQLVTLNNQFGNRNLVQNVTNTARNADLSEEDLLLASTTVYGFSLSDKVWLEFDAEKVEDVEWNEDAFDNLVLPADRKHLLQSLVEAHHQELGFDDFIKGKGHGLVINLFGPPGVGKTFSAEATSEHVKRPLYVIGGGDLGTNASSLDAALERIFDVATAWKAIVLIDEADVFLEQRSLHDLERNAMVAVFLRHVEYYRGILFLTTNRVQVFDEAFLSRIHVALHFPQLSHASKVQIWKAFITKAGAQHVVSDEQIAELAKQEVNGRQIKNAVRTAHSLARGRGDQVSYVHLMETMDAMREFVGV